jgi:phosphoribosylamine--glycine ligase/phosphoribosylformylglycinamidine cyclo-ligase
VKKTKNVDIGVSDFAKLVKFAQENHVNLVVPGPEVPLVGGIESWFRKGMCLFSSLVVSRNSLFWTH